MTSEFHGTIEEITRRQTLLLPDMWPCKISTNRMIVSYYHFASCGAPTIAQHWGEARPSLPGNETAHKSCPTTVLSPE